MHKSNLLDLFSLRHTQYTPIQDPPYQGSHTQGLSLGPQPSSSPLSSEIQIQITHPCFNNTDPRIYRCLPFLGFLVSLYIVLYSTTERGVPFFSLSFDCSFAVLLFRSFSLQRTMLFHIDLLPPSPLSTSDSPFLACLSIPGPGSFGPCDVILWCSWRDSFHLCCCVPFLRDSLV